MHTQSLLQKTDNSVEIVHSRFVVMTDRVTLCTAKERELLCVVLGVTDRVNSSCWMA